MADLLTVDSVVVTADGGQVSAITATAPTLGDMMGEIADDIARDDLTTQIRASILKAIKHFQSERLFFNEQYVGFQTVAGQEFYGVDANALLPDLYAIDSSVILQGNTTWELGRTDDAWIEAVSQPVSPSLPAWFSYHARQVRLYPVPDRVYTVRFFAHTKVAAPVGDDDTCPWVDEADELISARAKWRLAKHVLRDKGLASDMEDAMADAINELRGRTGRAVATGVVESYDL